MHLKKLSILIPTLLSGCSTFSQTPTAEDTPALVFLDGKINESTAIIANAQRQVAAPAIKKTITPSAISKTSTPSLTSAPMLPSQSPPLPSPKISPVFSRLIITGDLPVATVTAIPVTRNLTVSDATKRLLPAGWQLKQQNAATPKVNSRMATWSANDQWYRSLNKLLEEKNLWGHVDVPSKTLTLTTTSEVPGNTAPLTTGQTTPAAAAAAHNPFSGSGSTTTNTPAQTLMSKAQATEAVPAPPTSRTAITPVSKPPELTWQAEKGNTLRQTITKWASQANCSLPGQHWQVIWNSAVDYPVDAPFSVQGDWVTALGKTFELYRKARTPLFATVYMKQCTVAVADKTP